MLPNEVAAGLDGSRMTPVGVRGEVRLSGIRRGDAAYLAGLRSGDVLLTVGGRPAADADLATAIGATPTEVELVREGHRLVFRYQAVP